MIILSFSPVMIQMTTNLSVKFVKIIKLWFYRCEKCDFDAHPECALRKYPYIKVMGVYT